MKYELNFTPPEWHLIVLHDRQITSHAMTNPIKRNYYELLMIMSVFLGR